ncbi:alpha/beta fold hydrolase [Sediminibacterium goheungense]|uniref:Pimeloyl-ACP methyl ester carboxylesterase n=1 Tax=Sediminibacterium goheungense TaxID=1086393 RepID=A0A4R6IZR7_9BACT|nr:alpha/beta hydrolase [Sediminibacterium goheungense]TDO28363.1 pimeloyl-ACP methyl ester carboxylesterase [Sediminibacterium goheungense]
MKRTGGICLLVLVIWVIAGESCMKFRISDETATEKFKKAGVTLGMHTIQVNKRRLHYAKTGNDSFPTIVFVHGSPGAWNAFEDYMRDPVLLKKYRMISVDRPGFGYSDFRDAMNLPDQSMIIQALFTKEDNGRPVYLVGHSLGGPLIVQMAVDNPGYFDALVILAGSIDPQLEQPEKWRPLLMNNPLKFLVPGAMRPSNDELWYLKKDLKLLADKISSVSARVYVIHGDKDMLVPYANMAFAVKTFSHARVLDTLTLPGANHFIPWSHYKAVRGVLLKL